MSTTYKDTDDLVDTVWPNLRLVAGERAWFDASAAYSLSRGLYTAPFFDQAEHDEVCRMAMESARDEPVDIPHSPA